MFPDRDVASDQRKLKGFNWRFSVRPKDKTDIFRKPEAVLETPENKEIKEEKTPL
jgi:hypothetical protein